MKKLVLPLLLLLGISMLLAQAVSEPSEVVGYVKYEVVAGNSMVAVPMVNGALVQAGDIGNLVGATTVSYWDNAGQAFLAAEYVDWMGDWDNNFFLENGMALLVYSDAPTANFYSVGSLPVTQPSYPIAEGNSMVMIPLNRSDLEFAGMVGDLAGATTVSYWDNAGQAFLASEYVDWMGDWDNNFQTAIGAPLMVYAPAAGVFPSDRSFQRISNSK